jgi:hypothetical protein
MIRHRANSCDYTSRRTDVRNNFMNYRRMINQISDARFGADANSAISACNIDGAPDLTIAFSIARYYL